MAPLRKRAPNQCVPDRPENKLRSICTALLFCVPMKQRRNDSYSCVRPSGGGLRARAVFFFLRHWLGNFGARTAPSNLAAFTSHQASTPCVCTTVVCFYQPHLALAPLWHSARCQRAPGLLQAVVGVCSATAMAVGKNLAARKGGAGSLIN